MRAALAFGLMLAVPGLAPAQDDLQSDLTEEQARGLFVAGRAAFDAGRYEEALAHFRRAHELSPRARLLYNIALSADRLRLDDEAIDAYEAHLRLEPDSPERARVEQRLSLLRQQRAERAVQSSLAVEVAEPPDGRRRRRIALSVSAAVLVAGAAVVLAVWATREPEPVPGELGQWHETLLER